MTAGRWLIASLAPLLALTGAALPAAAQNLLVNPTFDTNLSSWTIGTDSVTVTWDGTRDGDGSTTSGSARTVWAASTVTGNYEAFTQCVNVNQSVNYRFGGKAFIPSGQALAGQAYFLAVPFNQSNCQGAPPPSAAVSTPSVTALDQWTETLGTITPIGGSILIGAYLAVPAGGTFTINYDDLLLEPVTAGCIADGQTLCLSGGRFQVTATYSAGGSLAGQAHVVPEGDNGLLWFFSSTNIEAVVKVIDGCAAGGHFWFFAGGLTNVQVVLTVVDTQTGAVRIYTNPQGTAFAPIQDTSAFACT
jgi:predicted enzyme related to lactoylglutathione lyase